MATSQDTTHHDDVRLASTSSSRQCSYRDRHLLRGWNFVGDEIFNALTPGLRRPAVGICLGGVLGGLDPQARRRRPSSLLAALARPPSATSGASRRLPGLPSLGAELIFLVFAYRRWGLRSPLAGAGQASRGCLSPRQHAVGGPTTYLVCSLVLAGAVGWLLTKALANPALSLSAAGSGVE